jgi:hypothetical protein
MLGVKNYFENCNLLMQLLREPVPEEGSAPLILDFSYMNNDIWWQANAPMVSNLPKFQTDQCKLILLALI